MRHRCSTAIGRIAELPLDAKQRRWVGHAAAARAATPACNRGARDAKMTLHFEPMILLRRRPAAAAAAAAVLPRWETIEAPHARLAAVCASFPQLCAQPRTTHAPSSSRTSDSSRSNAPQLPLSLGDLSTHGLAQLLDSVINAVHADPSTLRHFGSTVVAIARFVILRAQASQLIVARDHAPGCQQQQEQQQLLNMSALSPDQVSGKLVLERRVRSSLLLPLREALRAGGDDLLSSHLSVVEDFCFDGCLADYLASDGASELEARVSTTSTTSLRDQVRAPAAANPLHGVPRWLRHGTSVPLLLPVVQQDARLAVWCLGVALRRRRRQEVASDALVSSVTIAEVIATAAAGGGCRRRVGDDDGDDGADLHSVIERHLLPLWRMARTKELEWLCQQQQQQKGHQSTTGVHMALALIPSITGWTVLPPACNARQSQGSLSTEGQERRLDETPAFASPEVADRCFRTRALDLFTSAHCLDVQGRHVDIFAWPLRSAGADAAPHFLADYSVPRVVVGIAQQHRERICADAGAQPVEPAPAAPMRPLALNEMLLEGRCEEVLRYHKLVRERRALASDDATLRLFSVKVVPSKEGGRDVGRGEEDEGKQVQDRRRGTRVIVKWQGELHMVLAFACAAAVVSGRPEDVRTMREDQHLQDLIAALGDADGRVRDAVAPKVAHLLDVCLGFMGSAPSYYAARVAIVELFAPAGVCNLTSLGSFGIGVERGPEELPLSITGDAAAFSLWVAVGSKVGMWDVPLRAAIAELHARHEVGQQQQQQLPLPTLTLARFAMEQLVYAIFVSAHESADRVRELSASLAKGCAGVQVKLAGGASCDVLGTGRSLTDFGVLLGDDDQSTPLACVVEAIITAAAASARASAEAAPAAPAAAMVGDTCLFPLAKAARSSTFVDPRMPSVAGALMARGLESSGEALRFWDQRAEHRVCAAEVAAYLGLPMSGRAMEEGDGPRLFRFSPYEQAGLVQRLDVHTSGILLAAGSSQGFRHLRRLFTVHKEHVAKSYTAMVTWSQPHALIGKSLSVTSPLSVSSWSHHQHQHHGGAAEVATQQKSLFAQTNITVVRRFRFRDIAVVRCDMSTGRRHQVRKHLSSIGLPLLGDAKYGFRWRHVALRIPAALAKSSDDGPSAAAALPIVDLQKLMPVGFALHASSVTVAAPRAGAASTGSGHTFHTPLSHELQRLVTALEEEEGAIERVAAARGAATSWAVVDVAATAARVR